MVQALAWFGDAMVHHAETFWSLFAVDMDSLLEIQPSDTWDSFPLFQMLNNYLRTHGAVPSDFYFTPCRGSKFVISVFVLCLSLCILTTTCPNFTKFSSHVTCDLGSMQCDTLCTSGFVDDVMFSYNAGNKQAGIENYAGVSSSSPGGGTGGEAYRFRLHFVALVRASLRRGTPLSLLLARLHIV